MSYDIAIFEGETPSSHKAASQMYQALLAELEAGASRSRSPRVLALVDELAERWPGSSEAALLSSPWASWPLIDDAAGTLFLAQLRFSSAQEVIPLIARVAESHGLNCFDPQVEMLLAPAFVEPKDLLQRIFGN